MVCLFYNIKSPQLFTILYTLFSKKNYFPGDDNARATPDNIPNSEVKPLRADDTTRGTGWESRLLPGLSKPRSSRFGVSSFLAFIYLKFAQ